MVEAFSEHVDLMPTILTMVLGENTATIPRQCDGHSLTPFLQGSPPSFWRSHVCWEYDLRWGALGRQEVEDVSALQRNPIQSLAICTGRPSLAQMAL